MSTESQRAGWGALIAAAVGIAAVIAILVAGSRDEASRSPPSVTATRGFPSDEGPPDLSRSPVAPVAPVASARDAGTFEALDGAVAAPPPALPLPRAETTAAVPEPPAPPPPAELTPERRYEATAFVADLITVRLDTVRIELEAAREAGDAIRIRRLEANLAVLTEESARLNAITRGLERDLGRTGIAPPEEPAPEEELPLEE